MATIEPHTSALLTAVHGGATAPSAPRTWAKATTVPSLVTCTTGSVVASPSRWDWYPRIGPIPSASVPPVRCGSSAERAATMMLRRPGHPDGQVAQGDDVGLLAVELGGAVVPPEVDEVDASTLHLPGDLAPDGELARRHGLADLGDARLHRDLARPPPVALDLDDGGRAQRVRHLDVQPVALGADRGDRHDDAGRIAEHLDLAGQLDGRGLGRVAARRGDGVGAVAALGERHGADGQDRQHRRRGDSSTAAAQPAVPACGDPFEPVLGGVADG